MFAGVFSCRNLVCCRVPPVSLAFQETGQSLPVLHPSENERSGGRDRVEERTIVAIDECVFLVHAGLYRRQGPQGRCLVGGGAEKREFRWVPSAGDYFVLVLCDHHAGQGHR